MKTAQGLIHQSPALRKRAGAEERKTGRSGRQWDVEAEMGQAWNVVWKEQERMMKHRGQGCRVGTGWSVQAKRSHPGKMVTGSNGIKRSPWVSTFPDVDF